MAEKSKGEKVADATDRKAEDIAAKAEDAANDNFPPGGDLPTSEDLPTGARRSHPPE